MRDQTSAMAANRRNLNGKTPKAGEIPENQAETSVIPTEPEKRAVPKYRQCPLCYCGRGGVGQSNGLYKKASTHHIRYYRCDKCPHTWAVPLSPAHVLTPDD